MKEQKLILISLFLLGLFLAPVVTATVKKNETKVTNSEMAGFADSNIRYAHDEFPKTVLRTSDSLIAWKGERVHTQILLIANEEIAKLKVSVSDLLSERKGEISKKDIKTGFLRYVITDEFGEGCGFRKPKDFDSSLVADPIDMSLQWIKVLKKNVQPIWISIDVPENVPTGNYKAVVTLNGNIKHLLNLNIKVLDKVLPASANWKFNLDFWQHPAAIARVHGVKLWSKKHFQLMRPYYEMLAKAGQKNITVAIVEEPWGHQTYDDFPGLIRWIKKSNGTWEYDYSLFDQYVDFMMSCGIKERINCYSMVTWKLNFSYFDEKTGTELVCTDKPGTPGYEEHWRQMLTDFTRHLKQKAWFSKTVIAMDERPMPVMISVINLLKTIDPAWKVAMAGDYHPEIEKDVFDYSVASRWQYPDSVLASRRAEGKISTWYTCCVEKYPNGFTFSPPAEHVWTGIYTAAHGMDGFLRWAYNSWPAYPLRDSRFTAWPAGDTFLVYPGPTTSIRFEKMIEGIQDYEKIEMLRKEYKSKNQLDKLQKLENALLVFEIKALDTHSAKNMLPEIKNLLNQ